jgi:hypothetical protein
MVRFWCGFGATKKSAFLALWDTALLSLLQTRNLFVTRDKIHCDVANFCPNHEKRLSF